MKKYSKKYPNSFLNRKKKYYKKIEIKAIFIIHILTKNLIIIKNVIFLKYFPLYYK